MEEAKVNRFMRQMDEKSKKKELLSIRAKRQTMARNQEESRQGLNQFLSLKMGFGDLSELLRNKLDI